MPIKHKINSMNKGVAIFMIFLIFTGAVGCSKKTYPAVYDAPVNAEPAKVKTVKRATIKTALPKVIAVNGKAAKKSVDGRYYYDLEGHRYWRNNRDGKYYLFHKSMFENPDFKAPGN